MGDLLGRALRVFEEWVQDPERCEPAELLRLHPDVLEYLRPMLEEHASSPEATQTVGRVEVDQPTRLGDYRIVGRIGAGSMGVVYKAVHEPLGRVVALKVLPRDFAANERRLKLFKREAMTLARVNHRNVVQVFHVGEDQQLQYIAMEYIDGKSLAARLEALQDVPIRDRRGHDLLSDTGPESYFDAVATLLIDLLAGLSAIHSAGLVHRDLKPANIMLSNFGEVKIADFGLAKDADRIGETSLGVPVGTACYMSPEQASGSLFGLDCRSDLFSIGSMLFELIGARVPFRGSNFSMTLDLIMNSPHPSLAGHVVPRPLLHIVDRCLEKAPQCRYPSASVLSDDLGRLLRREPIAFGNPTALERIRRTWSATPRAVRYGITLLIASVVLTLTMLVLLAVFDEATRKAYSGFSMWVGYFLGVSSLASLCSGALLVLSGGIRRWRIMAVPSCLLAAACMVFIATSLRSDLWATLRPEYLLLERAEARLADHNVSGKRLVDAIRVFNRFGMSLWGRDLVSRDLNAVRLEAASVRGADLSHADLRRARADGSDFSDCSMRSTLLSGATLRSARLHECYMPCSKIDESDLTDADMRSSVIMAASFVGAMMRRTDLSRSYLRASDLRGVVLDSATLVDANLIGCELSRADVQNSDFSRADLTGATLDEVTVLGSTFNDASLSRASFDRCEMRHTILVGVDARMGSFRGSSLSMCDVSGATFDQVDFEGAGVPFLKAESASFVGAVFRGGLLWNANFSRANLNCADLTHAEVRETSFRNADLTEADLSHTEITACDLTGCVLVNARLRGVSFGGRPELLESERLMVQARRDLEEVRNEDEAELDLVVVDRLGVARIVPVRVGTSSDLQAALRDLSSSFEFLSEAATKMVEADLRGADLSDADLSGVDLRGALLSGANFSGANLAGADLTNSDVTGAIFTGAVGVQLSNAQLAACGAKP